MKKTKNSLEASTKTNLLMVAAMLLIGVANITWAERLTVNDGLGWDGVRYAAWTKNFYDSVFIERVPEYYVQRILPSVVVHYGRRLVLAPFFDSQTKGQILNDAQNIILSYDIYNLILLLISAYVWGLIADKLKIGNRGKWLGFCFLFLNYAILKHNFYHSVLTDTSAYALGILMFYFFLTRRQVSLLICTLLGAFAWPTLLYMGILLYVFPCEKDDRPTGLPPTAYPPKKLNFIFAAVATGVSLAAVLFLLYYNFAERFARFGRTLRPLDTSLLPLSILALLLYLFFGLAIASADARLFSPQYILKALDWRRVAVALGLLTAVKITVKLLASGEEFGWGDTRTFFIHSFYTALYDPFIFLVSHTIYYGPCILLLIFFWRRFSERIGRFGIGLRLLLIMYVIFGINSQSRFILNAMPIFIIVLVGLLEDYGLKPRHIGLWLVLSVLYSKVWYVFNTAPVADDGTLEVLLTFPLQHYFMNSGPWMSSRMYLAQGAGVLLTALAVLLGIKCGFIPGRRNDEPGTAGEASGGVQQAA